MRIQPSIIIPTAPAEPPRLIELQARYLRRRGLSAERAALVAALVFGSAAAEPGRAAR